MTFIDTHVHLHFPEFQADFDQVMERARNAGVRYFINIGTDLESSRKAVQLAERFEFVYAAVGIHPHDVKDAKPNDLEELARLAKNQKVAAIGEVGLDFFRNLSPKTTQLEFLVRFFELAKNSNLPLVLHIREAYDDMLALLREHFKPPVQAVSHCFSGTPEVMAELLNLGLYVSFAGPVTYKKSDPLREAARLCPEDRILVETDAPFLAPQAYRGQRNEPAFMVETARRIADLRGVPLEDFSSQTLRNAERLFGREFSEHFLPHSPPKADPPSCRAE
jgi:TatD DNase family protein